jgi:hypothetical protein
MLFILSMIVAVLLLLCVAACIMAPELADHDACKPLAGEDGKVTGRQANPAYKHIDVRA